VPGRRSDVASVVGSDTFAALVEALVSEHRRLEHLVSQLSSDNQRLRAELTEDFGGGAVSGLDARSVSRGSEPSSRIEVLVGDTPARDEVCPDLEGCVRQGASNEDSYETGRLLGQIRATGSADEIALDEGGAKRPQRNDSPRAMIARRHGSSVFAAEAEDGRLRRRQGSAMTLGTLASASALFWSSTNCTLPPKWPEWRGVDGEDSEAGFVSTAGGHRSLDRGLFCTQKAKSGGRLIDEAAWGSRCVLHPASTTRTLWDLLGLVIISYDLIFVPFALAGFSAPEATPFFEVADRSTACFWAFDILVNFSTGYHTGGLVEMRLSRIARRYLRTWLAVDLIVVIMDWVLIFVKGVAFLRLEKAKRLLRIIRTVRIVRSVKMTVKLAQLLESFRSEGVRILLNIGALALYILTLNHYFACGWFYVGTVSDTTDNWVAKHIDGGSVTLQYVTALHWSFTQFTPAGIEIHPCNFSERLYTVVTVFFAMITFSSFMGSITANMTALRRLSSERATQQKILQDYFIERGITAELGTRIWGYLKKNHFAQRRKALRRDIAVLKILPPSISCDLNEELYLPVLKHCPFFFYYGVLNYHGIRAICDSVVSEHALTLGERLFLSGTAAESMYFVTIGQMQYEHRDESLSTAVDTMQWVSEPCLWMKWYHCGTLEATTSCQLLAINSKKMRAMAVEQPRGRNYTRGYVSGFRAWMLQGDANPSGTWKTDIWSKVAQLKQIAFEAMTEMEGVQSQTHSRSWFRQHTGSDLRGA